LWLLIQQFASSGDTPIAEGQPTRQSMTLVHS